VVMKNYSLSGNNLPSDRREAARRLIAGSLSFGGPALSLGIEAIDARLPGHGLGAGLHEIAPCDHRGLPASWGFLLALTRLVAVKRGEPLFWPLARDDYDFGLPYGPGLRHFGFNVGDFLFACCKTPLDSLWAMEEALRSGSFAAIIGARARKMDLTMSRRLQLAAEETQTPILLLKHAKDETASAARTRWRVSPLPAARDRFGLMRRARWHIALERTRAGSGGEWVLEWNRDALRLCLSSLLAGGKTDTEPGKKSA